MTALTVELPPNLYARLPFEAERQGKPPEGVARVADRAVERALPTDERERSNTAMREVEPRASC